MHPVPPDPSANSADFFARLPLLAQAIDTFDATRYRPAPDDWSLVVTDVFDSTNAVADGRHKTVNFVAAMAIAALRNLCAPQPIPFLFGGDGAVVMVPPALAASARLVLARVRGLADRDFGLSLRVGMVSVAALRQLGGDLWVGRYEPTPGNSFGVFLGGGVDRLETAIKGRGDAALAAAAAIDEALDDRKSVDLSGLSCRWDELRSTHGKMVALILHGPADLGSIYAAVVAMAAPGANSHPVRLETLRARWPPPGFMLEARARRRGGLLALWVLRVLAETLVAKLVLARGRPIAGFDPVRYRDEVASNTDFCRFDETLCFVVDCAIDRIAAIEQFVASQAAAGGLRYGLHVSDTALMTCLVASSNDGLHVHFVDGGSGGYTSASRQLKAAAVKPAAGAACRRSG